ncbi:unnamed protein product [Candidula unifasciata]|uniref:L-Fucosyltransferase n=1 Tax=Candidula unifasciata TaxID=100452 RepID=A0A8S3YV62_9EUPU|nr:unnamed protein product [Candidula unifasciata]
MRGILKLMSRDTDSNNRSTKGTVTTNARYLTRQPLFLTLQGLHYGRLGNQMFMYASLLGIAHTLNRTAFISPGFSLDVAFKLGHVAEIPESETWPIAEQNYYAIFERTYLNKLRTDDLQHENLTLSGFFQSWKYFQNITETIRTEFLFRTPVLRQRDKILQTVLPHPKQEVILVGVHVRRSDLLSNQNIAMGYTVPDTSYFKKAFQWMRSKFVGEKVMFLVASDDFLWCENHLRGSDVLLMPPAPQAVHLALLSSCDHVIFSTGTFGWWGAWLAGGYVVYYKKYPGYGTNLSKGFSRDDFFPRHWVGLGD